MREGFEHYKKEAQRGIDHAFVDIGFIKNALKKKVDTDEFAALEKRVAMLEKRP